MPRTNVCPDTFNVVEGFLTRPDEPFWRPSRRLFATFWPDGHLTEMVDHHLVRPGFVVEHCRLPPVRSSESNKPDRQDCNLIAHTN